MDFTDLEVLTVLDELKNLTQVAAKLHLSQPTISKRIKNIESELGFKLLVRTNNGVLITKAGALICQQAKTTLATMANSIELARNVAKEKVLKIGAPAAVAEVIFPKLIPLLELQQLNYELYHYHSHEMEDKLAIGALNLAFKEDLLSKKFQQTKIYDDPIVLIANQKITINTTINSLNDLQNYHLLLFPWGQDYAQLSEGLIRAGLMTQHLKRVAPLSVAKNLLLQNSYLGFFPLSFIKKELAEKKLMLVHNNLKNHWQYSLYLAHSTTSEIPDGLLQAIVDHLR